MINIPDYYCSNLHQSLMISLEKDGKISVGPCSRDPVKFVVEDNKVFDHPKLVEFRDRNQINQTLEGHCLLCVPPLSHESPLGTCANRSSSNSTYITDKLLFNQVGPKMITFKLDYVCNLACVICGPDVSSKWRDIKKIRGQASQSNEDIIRRIIRNIDLSQLDTVHIFGGEPLFTRTHEIILEELSDYAKNITVWYDSNGTAYPSDYAMKLWERFHLIRLKFSIDGVGKVFEYLRWPGKWNKLEDNISKMIENLPVNHMLSLRCTVGFLNAHTVNDIVNWQRSFFPTNRLGDITEFEYGSTFGLYSLLHMTQQMVDDLYSIYSTADPIFNLIHPVITNDKILSDIKASLEKLDQQRGQDWRESLPHLIPYFKDY